MTNNKDRILMEMLKQMNETMVKMNNSIIAVQEIHQETNQRLDGVETEIKEVKQVLEEVDSTIFALIYMYFYYFPLAN